MCDKRLFPGVLALLLLLPAPSLPGNRHTEKRREYVEQLLTVLSTQIRNQQRVSPLDLTWELWQKRTGELPPNFDQMPSLPFLPDPLLLDEGGKNVPIVTMEQWRQKRGWIAAQYQHWLTGTFPPRPNNLRAKILSEKSDGVVTLRVVQLSFGPGHRAKLTLELLIPPGDGPFPVFMTQWNHRGWALVALRRGYLGCVYAGADAKDDTEAYADIWYPQYDFTRLMRRAWGASRAVDYLHTLPFVDKDKIALTGHSRNGKQTLLAAAFDERIKAAIVSGGGTFGLTPFRYTDDRFDKESIDWAHESNPSWLHPRSRFFVGREHKLPVDQNLLNALVAPRGLMLSSAITEPLGNAWAIEQNLWSTRRVYRFLGAEDRFAVQLKRGLHATSARNIESYVDLFDYVFGRGQIEPPRRLYYGYTFDKWLKLSGERINPLDYPPKGLGDLLVNTAGGTIANTDEWTRKKDKIREVIRWALGDEPPGATNPGPRSLSRRSPDDYLGEVIGRPKPTKTMARTVISPYASFGDYLYGNLYYPADGESRPRSSSLPVVMFLHEYDYTSGFARNSQQFFEALVNRGFAVFAFDMIGFGSRIDEGTLFYERYPHWSELGKMLADTRAAVDALVNLDFVNKGRIYTVGYALGGAVGLYAAALDDRITGVASVCGFTPMRLAIPKKGIEGIQAYSHLHGLVPRLGFFFGRENRLPYDFHEILASIAPRPVLLMAPEWDRHAVLADVKECVGQARHIYRIFGNESALTLSTPSDYNRFPRERQTEVVEWLADTAAQ